jgi:hypothetical protein
MTTGLNTNPATAPVAPVSGVPMPKRTYPRRRNPALASLGVLLVVIGALAGWQFVRVATAGDDAVIAVYQQVPQGGKLTAADLQVVRIAPVKGLTPVPASMMSAIVGQYATVTLMPGTLLTTAEVTRTTAIGADQAVVGLELTAPQRPQRALRPGDHVLLIQVPAASGGTTTDASVPDLPVTPATVQDVGEPDNQDTAVVDVLVPQSVAGTLAALANLQRVSVVLVSGG